MTSIGETLRRERLRRNLELDPISKELKISPRLLEAMEADRFDKLPGGVFTRSFVRQYARELGLDDQEIAASLERMLNPPPAVAPEVAEPKPPAAVNLNLDLDRVIEPVKNWLRAGDSGFGWSSTLRSLGLVVVVALLCAAIYSWLQPRPHTVEIANRAPMPAATKAPPVAPATPAASAVSPPAAGTAERLAAPVRVELSASEPVWVTAATDGKYAFSGTILPNTSRTIEGNDRVFLKLGNAGGAHLLLNGKPVGPFGADGEVVRLQFTSGGFQIVPAEAPTPEDGPKEPDGPLDPL